MPPSSRSLAFSVYLRWLPYPCLYLSHCPRSDTVLSHHLSSQEHNCTARAHASYIPHSHPLPGRGGPVLDPWRKSDIFPWLMIKWWTNSPVPSKILVIASRSDEYIKPMACREQNKWETMKSLAAQRYLRMPGSVYVSHTTLRAHSSKTAVNTGYRSVHHAHLYLPVYRTTPMPKLQDILGKMSHHAQIWTPQGPLHITKAH